MLQMQGTTNLGNQRGKHVKGCNPRGTTVERNCRHIVATDCWKQIGAVKLGARKQKVTRNVQLSHKTRS